MSKGINKQSTITKPLTIAQKTTAFLSRQLTNNDSFGAYFEPIIQLIRPHWRHARVGAEVLFIKNETENTYTLTLRPEKKWSGFVAGQYIQLSVEKDGAMLTRTFSISCSPKYFLRTGEISITIRSQDKGLVTPWLSNALKSGDYVYLSEAQGEFQLSRSSKDKVFIAGGSGLTPIFSMLNEYQNSSWFKSAHLLFYVNNSQSLFFAEQISHLESKGLQVSIIFSDHQGRIDQQQLEAFIEDLSSKEFYVCGPGKMIETTETLLKSNQVPSADIHFEYFGQQPLSLEGMNLDDADELIQVDYLDSRKQVTFNPQEFIESDKATLLEISEKQGLKPVAGCRMGVCHQCICKKKTGRVFNTRTQQYSDTGEEEIQLCISVPVGKVELEL